MKLIILRGPEGVRFVEQGKPYRLLPGESPIGTTILFNKDPVPHTHTPEEQILDDTQEKIGAGDVLAKVFKETGFTEWWNKNHKGDCLPCKKRQAVANYLQFKGPKWLSEWVKDNADS